MSGSHLRRNQCHFIMPAREDMAEKAKQTRGFWKDLSLPDEYPDPHVEDKTQLNEDTEGDRASCSRNLLQMLKAAEHRWTPQSRDKAGASEAGTGTLVTEALKTDMVSCCAF